MQQIPTALRPVVLLGVFFTSLSSLVAQTWNGAGSDDNFTTSANWSGGLAPTNDGSADVTLSGATRLSPTLDADRSINSLTLNSASSFTLQGTNTLSINSTLTGVSGGASNHYIEVPLAINGGLNVLADNAFLYLKGAISGTGGITGTGIGRMIFGSDNTYTGTTSMTGAQLHWGYYGNPTGGGSNQGDVVLGAGSNLSVYRSQDLTYSGSISAAGSNYVALRGIGQTDNAVITFTGSNTYTGSTLIYNGATLKIGAENTLASNAAVRVQGTGLLHVAENQTLLAVDNNFGGAVQIDANKTLTVNPTGSYYAGNTLNISGQGRMVKTGSQTYTFGGGTVALPNGITVAEGTLAVQGNTNITGPIENNAIVQFNHSDPLTYAGTLSGTGRLEKQGSGDLTLSGAGNTSTGATYVLNGRLVYTTAGALAPDSQTQLFSNAGIVISADQTINKYFSGGTTTSLQIDSGSTLTINNPFAYGFQPTLSGAGNLTKAGSQSFTLSGSGSLSGTVTANAGTLIANGTYASADFQVNSGGTLMGSGTIDQVNVASGGRISAGDLRQSGNLTLSALNLEAGSGMIFSLRDATGTAGNASGWDQLTASGTIAISATSANPFTLYLESLAGVGLLGSAANFDGNATYAWDFTTGATALTGFNASAIAIDTTNFANAAPGSFWVSQTGNQLTLNYGISAVPEPSAFAAIFGLACLGFAAGRRRRRA